MLSHHRFRPLQDRSAQKGSALLEGLLAVLIFSIGILGLVGLQGASMKNATLAKIRIDASLVANDRIARLWVDRDNLASYAEDGTAVATLPAGTRTTVIVGNQVTVTVTWQLPGDSMTHSYRTVAQINGNS